jgi:type II secretory pathway pseudopilin PulG
MLVEMLVVIGLFGVVLAFVLHTLVFADNETPRNIDYGQAISNATGGVQRMMREIRAAYRIEWTNGDGSTGVGSQIDFNAIINDQDLEIEYACNQPSPSARGLDACVRVSTNTGGAMPSLTSWCTTRSASPNCATVVVDRVNNPTTVFTFRGANGNPNPVYPTYVEADVQVPAKGQLASASGPLAAGLNHTITLDDGTSMPNLENGG